MTYDALLAARGVGIERFGPELLDATRWALFAERLMPILTDYQAVQGTPLPKGDAKAAAAATPRRLEANRQIDLIREALFPDG